MHIPHAKELPDGRLLIPKQLFALMNKRMGEFEAFYAKRPELNYYLQGVRKLPSALRSAQVQPDGDVIVSDAARRYLAKCMHDLKMTFKTAGHPGVEKKLTELDKLLGVQKVGEPIDTRDKVPAQV